MRNWFSKSVAQELGEKDVVPTEDESPKVTESRWTTYSNILRKRFSKAEPKVEQKPEEEPKIVSKIQKTKNFAKYCYCLLLVQLLALKNLMLESFERSNAAIQSSSRKLKTLISRKPKVENLSPAVEETKKEEKVKKEEKKEEPVEARKPSIVESLMTNLKLKKVEAEPVKPATRKEIIQAKMMKATVSVKYVFGLMVTQLVLLRNIIFEYVVKTKSVVTEQTSKTVSALMNSQMATKLKSLAPKKQLSKVEDETKTTFVQNVLKYCGVRL